MPELFRLRYTDGSGIKRSYFFSTKEEAESFARGKQDLWDKYTDLDLAGKDFELHRVEYYPESFEQPKSKKK